ncbi:hypothetical protein [Anatilimnocola floriformis]|uniref:hypothetical protein n=1 Tax=Anatilimnocola floriformis TaxID=2948575 RepID=UPI0020C37A84|nr:hypothetical protein [Anatilimnocola floriformis]
MFVFLRFVRLEYSAITVWFLFVLVTTLTAAEPAKRERTYESPEKAFLGYQQAVEDKAGKLAYEALTTESQSELLFKQWSDELTGDAAPLGIGELIDPDLRKNLTREHLPTTRRDLPPLLVKSIANREAAFQKIVTGLNRYRSNNLRNLRAKDVQIKGDTATAKVAFKDEDSGPDSDPLHFVKDEQGWMVDLRSSKARQGEPELTTEEVSWERPVETAHHDSPAAVFEAWERAKRKCDASLASSAVTPEYYNDFLFNGRSQLLGENGETLVLHWYGDQRKFVTEDNTNPPPSAQAQRARAFVVTRFDEAAYFNAILKKHRELEESRGRRVHAELGEVKQDGSRARGIVKYFFQPIAKGEAKTSEPARSFAYQLPCYFQQTKDRGWRFDLPTGDERQREQLLQRTAREERAASASRRGRAFASPEEVYASFDKAQKDWNAAAVRDCFPTDNVETLIYMAWAYQFHFRDDPPTLQAFIDEDRRRQLTREQVPIEEFRPLLIDSLTDVAGAFAASMHRLKLAGELEDLQIEGNTATGRLLDRAKPKKTKEDYRDPQVSDIGFSKDKQGWVIDLKVQRKEKGEAKIEREPLTAAEKKANQLEAELPKRWTHKAPVKYEQPKDALLGRREAFAENDPEKLWHTFSRRQRDWYMRNQILQMVESGGGDLLMAWYLDMSKMPDKQAMHTSYNRGVAEGFPPLVVDENKPETSPGYEARERLSHERERLWDSVVVSMIYDQEAYFSAIVKRRNLILRQQQTRDPDLDYDKLTDVKIDGNRAVGTMQSQHFSYDAQFAREDGSWKIDVANLEEHMAKWRKDEQKNFESRQKYAAERKVREKEKEE